MRIRFESLELRDFAIYPSLFLEFSTDDSKPLTIIRGENNSGKTTLMRAFIWLLFGEKHVTALDESTHPIRPPWAPPNEDVTAKAELRFRVTQDTGTEVTYKLVRTGRTRVRDGRVSYVDDDLNLYRRDAASGFQESNDRLGALQKKYFPEGMREFILIDADKAEELVGGPESNHNDALMRHTTTTAVRALLGVEPMKAMSKRLKSLGDGLMSKAARDSGNRDLQKLADAELDTQKRCEQLQEKVDEREEHVAQLDEKYRAQARALEGELKKVDETKSFQDKLNSLNQAKSALAVARGNEVTQFADQVTSESALGVLFLPLFDRLVSKLEPLKADGRIPASELNLLPRLLKEGKCVCGLSFDEHPERRQEIERQIELSDPKKRQANFGDQALEFARDCAHRVAGVGATDWAEQLQEHRARLGELDQKLEAVSIEIGDVNGQIDSISGSLGGLVAEQYKNHETLGHLLQEEQKGLAMDKKTLESLFSEHRSASEKLRLAKAQSAKFAEAQAHGRASVLLADVIDRARVSIESEQVDQLDQTIDALFKDVVSATETSHYTHVGVRVAGSGSEYEPYVLGPQGEDKPLSIANGASRRAVATSLVLALSKVTGTSIPFVADSLLHSTSGSVKRKLVDYLSVGDYVGQPIIFATRDDLLGLAADVDGTMVRDIVRARAGATYTVTSQADVGGQVLRADPDATQRLQAVVCNCGADEYCDVCERVGDSAAGHLQRIKGINR